MLYFQSFPWDYKRTACTCSPESLWSQRAILSKTEQTSINLHERLSKWHKFKLEGKGTKILKLKANQRRPGNTGGNTWKRTGEQRKQEKQDSCGETDELTKKKGKTQAQIHRDWLINETHVYTEKKGREETKAGHGESQQKERHMRTNSTNSLNLTPLPLCDLHKQRRA